MNDKDWTTAVKLRGRSFQRNLETYKLLTKLRTVEKDNLSEGHTFTVAVMNVGAPAGGLASLCHFASAAPKGFIITLAFFWLVVVSFGLVAPRKTSAVFHLKNRIG